MGARKFTMAQAEEIRDLRRGGMGQPELGVLYGVGEDSIRRICAAKYYKGPGVKPILGVNAKRKLSDADVIRVRLLRQCGALVSALAKEYGMDARYMGRVCNGFHRVNVV
jgi:hypothetical protein